MALKKTAQQRRGLPLLALGGVALLAGLWAGLIRLGWALPSWEAGLAIAHGPLMVSGFLGVVISLERAAALGRLWGFAGPILAGLGALALLGGLSPTLAAGLFAVASLVLLVVFVRLLRLRPDAPGVMLALGAALWLAGNGLWLAGLPLLRVVPWWTGFLVLTIAAERLELAQLLFSRRVQAMLVLAGGLVLAGLLVSLAAVEPGVRLAGLGLLALAAWLVRYDIARRTLRRRGLARYSAACLLLGYLWLGAGGLFWLLGADRFGAGLWYDAMLHSIFLGFVFSMIFGHAPTIIPAVTGILVPFTNRFYLHLALLHASLVLRVAGDLGAWPDGRRWGGLLNEVAILLFVGLTVLAVRHGPAAPAIGARPTDRRGPAAS